MRKVLYLATMSLVATLLFAPAAALAQEVPFPQGTPPVNGECPEGTQPSINGCVTDEALGEYLGAIGEGDPCPDPNTVYTGDGCVPAQYSSATLPPTAASTPAALPDTGGALLLPIAGVLLLASGLVGLGMAGKRS